MHIDDVQRLRGYLVHRLRPLTDADPEALADYTVALLRHDKDGPSEMQAFCSRQLREFMRADSDADAFATDIVRYVTIGNSHRAVGRPGPPVGGGDLRDTLGPGDVGGRDYNGGPRDYPQRDYQGRGPRPPYPNDRGRRTRRSVSPPMRQERRDHFADGRAPYRPTNRSNEDVRTQPHVQRENPALIHIEGLPFDAWKVSAVAAAMERFGTLRCVATRGSPQMCRADAEYVRPEDAREAITAGGPAVFNVEGVKFTSCETDANGVLPRSSAEPVSERQREVIRNMADLQRKKQEMLAKNLEARADLVAQLDALAEDDPARTELTQSIARMDDLIRSLGGVPPRPTSRGPRFAPLTLDLRATSLRISPVPESLRSADPRAVLEAHGQLRALHCTDDAILVEYARRSDAENAMAALSMGCHVEWISRPDDA